MSAQNIVGERAYHIYQSFNGATQTGMLTDKSLSDLNPRDFSNIVMDSTNKMSAYGFERLYLTMALSPVNASITFMLFIYIIIYLT
jgi:hypothetical protein